MDHGYNEDYISVYVVKTTSLILLRSHVVMGDFVNGVHDYIFSHISSHKMPYLAEWTSPPWAFARNHNMGDRMEKGN
jgi:hypothetical protein